jgi:hypothetical protein
MEAGLQPGSNLETILKKRDQGPRTKGLKIASCWKILSVTDTRIDSDERNPTLGYVPWPPGIELRKVYVMSREGLITYQRMALQLPEDSLLYGACNRIHDLGVIGYEHLGAGIEVIPKFCPTHVTAPLFPN